MSIAEQSQLDDFDLAFVRPALLRYEQASNWVCLARDPTPRMTVGLGFDVARPGARELMTQVGLDPAAVRGGRMPVTDAQMTELFDLTLSVAVGVAQERVPNFAGMDAGQQWALLELILWLGPEGTDAAFSELRALSLPLTNEPPEAAAWFDAVDDAAGTQALEIAPLPRSGPLSQPTAPAALTPRRITFESFGLVAELESDDPGLLTAAEAMLPPGWQAVDDPPGVHFGVWSDGAITIDGTRVDRVAQRPPSPPSLLELGAIIRHHLATEAPEFAFVHAGVVDAGGCGIVIPGRSYTGKSTLVAELVRLGATYVSDEYAVIDRSGLVQPFAKPVSVRTDGEDQLGELVPVPAALVADHPVRVGLIVLTSYVPGARWYPSVRSRAEAALALLQNTVSARLRPGPALAATCGLARAATFLVGQRGEACDAAAALLETTLLDAGGSTTFPA
jgi:hypothetical protein